MNNKIQPVRENLHGNIIADGDSAGILADYKELTIERVAIERFMGLHEVELSFSPNINIISGVNSTGKTAILKLMYASIKGREEAFGKDGRFQEAQLAEKIQAKLQGVFQLDAAGKLVEHGQDKAKLELGFKGGRAFSLELTQADSELKPDGKGMVTNRYSAVYIPDTEIISSAVSFASVYRKVKLDFEETCYDIAESLCSPQLRKLDASKEKVINLLSDLIMGQVVFEKSRFILRQEEAGQHDDYEMGLVSEGYRKIATLIYLIKNGTLNENSVLFWDEPENGMNPQMIKSLTLSIRAIADMGVQVFIATHDYFLLQYLNIYDRFDDKNNTYRYFSLYREDGNSGIQIDSADKMADLHHNSIMEEFENIYMNELEYMDGNS